MEKKPYHHKDLKRTLIEKGIEIVSSEGSSRFSLRRVAAACGVSHAAPYSHFKSKEELMTAMQQYIADQFSMLLEDTIRHHENDPELLLYMGKAYVAFFLCHPHYFTFLYLQSDVNIDISAESSADGNFRPFVVFREAAFSRFSNTGLSQQEKNDLVIALWAAVHGIASIASMKHVTYDEAWDQKIVDMLKALGKIKEAGL